MSLYEAVGYLFYGIRVQRHGRGESGPFHLRGDSAQEIVESAIESRLAELGHVLPDWLSAPEGPTRTSKYREYKSMLRELSYGCGLIIMGSGEVDDEVIFAAVSDSKKTCSSEDDHGGFGAKTIAPEQLVAPPEWDANLRKFCEMMQIPYTQPTWTLSMRG